jgi:hypothetical protein
MTPVCLACVNEPAGENSYAYSIYGGETLTPLASPSEKPYSSGRWQRCITRWKIGARMRPVMPMGLVYCAGGAGGGVSLAGVEVTASRPSRQWT